MTAVAPLLVVQLKQVAPPSPPSHRQAGDGLWLCHLFPETSSFWVFFKNCCYIKKKMYELEKKVLFLCVKKGF